MKNKRVKTYPHGRIPGTQLRILMSSSPFKSKVQKNKWRIYKRIHKSSLKNKIFKQMNFKRLSSREIYRVKKGLRA